MMKQKVCVFGSAVVDLMSRAPHLPAPGETVKGSYFRQSPGGKGFNQGIAAHKAGGNIVMISKLGRDALSHVSLHAMEEVGLSAAHLLYHDEVATGTALILVDESSSQNEIVIVPGACATFTEADICAIADEIRSAAYLLVQLEVNQDANERVVAIAREAGVRVIINTAPFQPVSDAFLSGAYLVTPNEVEAEALTGIAVKDLASADAAAAVLFSRGVQNVLITLGSRGLYLHDGKRSEIIPSYHVHAVDTTGAGDAFNGGLLTALSEGQDLWQAARFANALAALSVQRIGAAPSMPTRAEIDAFLASQN